MTASHRRHSRTTMASSMGALFIRVLFIGSFVYAWFLIARTPSSDNDTVLFGEDNFTSDKRVNENHLEVDKLIPVENVSNLLHSAGLPAESVPATYPPFHDDRFLHPPPSESLVENQRKPHYPSITAIDSSLPSSSAADEKQQYDVVKYDNNMTPILDHNQNVTEKYTVNLQVPITNTISYNDRNLVNIKTNSSSDLEKQYPNTMFPANNEFEKEVEVSPTPVEPVNVFSNFKDKLLNIIMPKSADEESKQANFTSGNKSVSLETQNQYSTSENESLDRASSLIYKSLNKSASYVNGITSIQPWKENGHQANSRQQFRFEEQDTNTKSERNDDITLSNKSELSYKQAFGNNVHEPNNTQPNNIEDNINIQSLRRPGVRQDMKLRQQIRENYHVEPRLGEESSTIKSQISEAVLQGQDSRNDVCPAGDIITVAGGGRLANCIWEYASLWSLNKFLPGNRKAYAQKYIMEYLVKIFDNLNMPVVEDIPQDCACCKNVDWAATNIHMYSFFPLREVQKRFENIPGHIILPMYIVLIEPVLATMKTLKKEMKYKDSLVQSAQNVIKTKTRDFLLKNNVQQTKITYVGVHVRRTDYKIYLPSKYNMTAVGPDFYLKAMTYFRERRPDLGRPIFLVVSDDVLWVQKHLIRNDVFVVSRGGVEHPEHDLVLLSLCNHSIVDYGTYGLWAAVYAGGVTVTVKTNMQAYHTLGRKPNWHFVSVKPGKEIEIY